MNTSTLPPGWDQLLTEYAKPGHETDPDKGGRPVTQRTRPPVARQRKTKPKGVLLKEAFVKRKSRAIGVKEYLTLNSFLRKLPVEHKRLSTPHHSRHDHDVLPETVRTEIRMDQGTIGSFALELKE